jgi:hypothetical protein
MKYLPFNPTGSGASVSIPPNLSDPPSTPEVTIPNPSHIVSRFRLHRFSYGRIPHNSSIRIPPTHFPSIRPRSARAPAQRPTSAGTPARRPQSARITRPLIPEPPAPSAVAIEPAPPVRFTSGGGAAWPSPGPLRSPVRPSPPPPPPPPLLPSGAGVGGRVRLRLQAAGVEAVAGLTHELDEGEVLQVRGSSGPGPGPGASGRTLYQAAAQGVRTQFGA